MENSPNEVANEAVDGEEGVVAQIRTKLGQGRGGGRGLASDRGRARRGSHLFQCNVLVRVWCECVCLWLRVRTSGSLCVCLRRAPPETPSRGPARTTALPRTCTRSSLAVCECEWGGLGARPALPQRRQRLCRTDGRTPLATNSRSRERKSTNARLVRGEINLVQIY